MEDDLVQGDREMVCDHCGRFGRREIFRAAAEGDNSVHYKCPDCGGQPVWTLCLDPARIIGNFVILKATIEGENSPCK